MFNKAWIIIFICLPAWLYAVPDVSLELHRFRAGANSFAEISMYIVGSSLACKNDQYGVDYMVIIKDRDKNVVEGQRYRLTNHVCPAKDMIDSKRFLLTPGNYEVEVEILDIHDSLNSTTILVNTEIVPDGSNAQLSDIQLLSVIRNEPDITSPLHKSGLYLEPLPFGYYYPSLNQLNLYLETYHADQLPGQPFIQYTLKPEQGEIPAEITAYRKVKKEPASAQIFQLDIKDLISGNYLLETYLFDGNKKLIDQRVLVFSRYSPVADSAYIAAGSLNLDASFVNRIPEDSLDYYLKAMAPVVNSLYVEVMNSILEKGNAKSKRFFIHKYWTDEAGKFADRAYNAYMKVAKVVDENYRSGFGYGFETDRGHIFLKYGMPDEIIPVEDEPSAPPYEIWYYTDFPATGQTNVRFLFYNPTLARNAYTLLHSTAIGETKNPRWEVELYKDATLETPGVNTKVMGDNVHRNARKYFEN